MAQLVVNEEIPIPNDSGNINIQFEGNTDSASKPASAALSVDVETKTGKRPTFKFAVAGGVTVFGLALVVTVITVPAVLLQNENCPDNTTFLENSECGWKRTGSSRIVGGARAGAGSWPWMVSLRDFNNDHICGASVINEEWLVTAAHCAPDLIEAAFLGDVNLNPTSHVDVNVAIFPHPHYDESSQTNDIALVKLSQPIRFDDEVQPICLPTSPTVAGYQRCAITGWGHTREDGIFSNSLLEADVNLIQDETCRNLNIMPSPVISLMICAGALEGGVDACQGDSGGPLQCEDSNGQWHLVGITSYGDGCGRPNQPGIYTRVPTYTGSVINTMIGDRCNAGQCDDITCQNGGTCHVVFEQAVCECPYLYRGPNCEEYQLGASQIIAITQSEPSITINSQETQNVYPTNKDEMWVVRAPEGCGVTMEIVIAELEDRINSLYIGTGEMPTRASKKVRLTGVDYHLVVIKNPTFWIRFLSEGFGAPSELRLELRLNCDAGQLSCTSNLCYSGSECTSYGDTGFSCACRHGESSTSSCNEVGSNPFATELIDLPTNTATTILSPNYPGNYPDNFAQAWVVTVPSRCTILLRIWTFDLNGDTDSMTFGSGTVVTAASGIVRLMNVHVPFQYHHRSSAGWIVFTSDSFDSAPGFNLTVTSVCP